MSEPEANPQKPNIVAVQIPADLFNQMSNALGQMPFNQVGQLMMKLSKQSIPIFEPPGKVANPDKQGAK
jgi:hypothetical protein